MYQPRRLRITASILLCFVLQTQGADKYTDENRPYEFGFKIDGQQHRHESKDKDGIIMGEFGFITADDVYHVTVYATDKEGRFKILSMKNIHLKSSPALSSGLPTSPRQGHALALPPAQPASVQAPSVLQGTPAPQGIPVPQGPPPALKQQLKPISIAPPARSCSSCSLPPTTTRAPQPSYNEANENNNYNTPNQIGGQQNILQGGVIGASYGPQGGQQNYPPGQQNYPQQTPSVYQNNAPQPGQVTENYPNAPSYNQASPKYSPNIPNNYVQPGSVLSVPTSDVPQSYPREQNGLIGGVNGPYGPGPRDSADFVPPAGNFGQVSPQQAAFSGPIAQSPKQSSYPQGGAGERTSKQYNGPQQLFDSNLRPDGPQAPGSIPGGQRGPAKPTLVSAQMQIVDKNTDIHALRPGEKKGLPPGLSNDDMTQLLYTFNYTVGFHGHFEEGFTNGAKKGYYYVTGRNGVRTRIDYVADDSGFHPKVSQEVLDLLSDDVPKPETEKDAKYGLKGYEFKWLYYPVEDKS